MDAISPGAADADLSRAPKLKVFISYSRDDLQFADQLDAALDLCNFESVLDRHGISGGEEWKQRLGSLIRDATRSYSCFRRLGASSWRSAAPTELAAPAAHVTGWRSQPYLWARPNRLKLE